MEVIITLEVDERARAQRDVRFDLLSRTVDVLRHPGDLKHGVFLSARRHDVGVRLLLDAFDRGSFGSHHETHDSVGNAHLDGGLSREVRRAGKRSARAGPACARFAARGSYHGEVLCCRDNLTLGHFHVFAATRHDEHGIFSSHGGFDVGVCFCTQCFDLATCRNNQRKTL